MAASEERMKILTLVEQGKITPEEGVRLIQALERAQAAPVAPTRSAGRAVPSTPTPRWLRVCVTDMQHDKVRVNIRLPVTVLNTGMKLGARFSPEIGQVEMEQILEAIRSGTTGPVVDVVDDDDHEHVEIFLE